MASQTIRIRLKAFDYRVLDASTLEIVNTAKRTGAPFSLPDQIGLPVPWRAVPVHITRRLGVLRDEHPALGHCGAAGVKPSPRPLRKTPLDFPAPLP